MSSMEVSGCNLFKSETYAANSVTEYDFFFSLQHPLVEQVFSRICLKNVQIKTKATNAFSPRAHHDAGMKMDD